MVQNISTNIYDLKGEGEEWLLDKEGGFIVAKFIDGNMMDADGQTFDIDAWEDKTLIL